MDIKRLQKDILTLAKKKGWGHRPSDIIFSEKIALIHQEVSEALEAYRQHTLARRHGVAEELADILLRTVHLAGIYAIDIEEAIRRKMRLNQKRNWHSDQLYIDKRKRERKIKVK